MTTRPHIVHIKPARGGIADYAEKIDAIYRQLGYQLQPVSVGLPEMSIAQLASELARTPPALYHFELGAGDSRLFQVSRVLRQRSGIPQLLTIHDPGVIIWHPFDVPGTASPLRPVQVVAKAGRLVLNRSFGRRQIRHHLASRNLSTMYLRPDLANSTASYYLPQPTYHEKVSPPVHHHAPPKRIGFSGYWDPTKGIETLLAAWARIESHPDVKLVIAGSTASPHDPYARALRQTIGGIRPPVELVGFIDSQKLDAFLSGLDALVLPYHAAVPNGTSAMAMRAAELGTPIIASDIPSLRGELENGAQYVPPGDAEALASAITGFLAQPATHYERAQTTQTAIFAAHNWKVVGQQLQKIVEAVMKAPA